MLPYQSDIYAVYEKLLAEAIRDVVSEFRLIDITDLISYIGLERMGILESLIDSATELYFEPGCLLFTKSARSTSTWSDGLSLSLNFLFQHEDLKIYFTLHLRTLMAGVQIDYIAFGNCLELGDEVGQMEKIAAALVATRRRPADNRLAWWSACALSDCWEGGSV